MANSKLSALTAYTTPVGADLFYIADTGASASKKITYANLLSKAPAGTVTAPTWAFTGDPNSGLYWIGADNIGLALGGVKTVDFGAAQIAFPDGSVGAPGWSFTGDTNTGVYRIGADNIGVTLGGVLKVDIGVAAVTFQPSTVSPSSLDGSALGSASLAWSDLFLASGGVINWNNGDVTATHAANSLAFAGATTSYTFDTVVAINDTSDAKLTTGLIINQGGADNHIVSLKSSDVAHGITDHAETDTFGFISKYAAATGGLNFRGFAATGVNNGGLVLQGCIADAADATKSTAGRGVIRFNASVKSGTNDTAVAGNGNLVNFDTNGTCRFILDSDGDSHQDVGTAWTEFDDHDDIALLNHLNGAVVRRANPVGQDFRQWLDENRQELQRLKLVTFNDDGHHFVNMSKLTMLHTGALRQLGQRFTALETALLDRVALLERQLLALQGG